MAVVIIVAGGSGKRMIAKENKIFLTLANNSLIKHTIDAALNAKMCTKIVVVAKRSDWSGIKKSGKKKILFALGGTERMDSVMNGLDALRECAPSEIVVVHNAANPWISSEEIDAIIMQAQKHGAAMAGFPVVDTLKRIDGDGMVKQTIDRTNVWHAQTPQAAQLHFLRKGYELAKKRGIVVTDEASALSLIGQKIKMVPTSRLNVKITFPSDLLLLEKYVGVRIGFGKDTHLFTKGKKIVLGGLLIPSNVAMQGNSDGDVVLHAFCTALAQCWGGYSLGYYTDVWCKGGITDSKEYARRFMNMLIQKKLKMQQIAFMIETDKIKIDPLVERLKSEIAKVANIKENQIGISATSGEGLVEGITAYCIVVVNHGNNNASR